MRVIPAMTFGGPPQIKATKKGGPRVRGRQEAPTNAAHET